MKNTSVYDNTYCGFFVEHLKFQFDTPTMKSSHYHDFYEIYYYLGSSMNYFVGDKNYVLEKNNILLIDKYAYHKTTYNYSNENERILVEFSEDVFDFISDKDIINKMLGLFRNINKLDLGCSVKIQEIHTILFNMVSNYKSGTPYGVALAKLNLAELCLKLVEFSEIHDINNTNEGTNPRKVDSNVVEIIKYINENYNEKITLDTLVDRFYANKFYLCHVFKNETGLSIIDFVNSKRLSEAEKLLRYSEESITDICYKVGFSSINHFLKLFKHMYNVTPKNFRTEIRSKRK